MKCDWDCFNCYLPECIRGESMTPAKDRYTHSNKGIATRQAYVLTDARKSSVSKYNKSQKRKEALQRYNQSEKGRACRARYKQRKKLEALMNDTTTSNI